MLFRNKLTGFSIHRSVEKALKQPENSDQMYRKHNRTVKVCNLEKNNNSLINLV